MHNLLKLFSLVLCLATVVSTVFLYYPGLNGPYLFDDSHVVQSNQFLRITALNPQQLITAMESFAGGGRQVSMLSFALNFYFFGESIWWLKFINLIIHCINGVLLFKLTGTLVSRLYKEDRHATPYAVQLIPVFVTAIWLVSPINLTSVLYVSQRMASLATLCTLLGLLTYIWARTKIKQDERKLLYIPLIVLGFTAIGYLCKENGVLLPLYIVLIELLVFRFKTDSKFDRPILLLFGSGLLILFAATGYIIVEKSNWLIGGYRGRTFTLVERVLTQFRVIMFYLSQIILPSNFSLGLWHDDFATSKNLLSPITTLLSLLSISILSITAYFLRNTLTLITFGIFWFFVSHSIESTFIPLEMVHEHRNYLASFGILLAFIVMLSQALKNTPIVFYTLIGAIFAWHSYVLADRAEIWSSRVSLFEHEAVAHPNSPSAVYNLGIQHFQRFHKGESQYAESSKKLLLKLAELQPTQISAEIALTVASEMGTFEFDPIWLERATKKFPGALKDPAMQLSITGYITCLETKNCTRSLDLADDFFQVVSESNNYRFKTFAAIYFHRIKNNPEKAEQFYKEALVQRDATPWTNYLWFLIRESKIQEACSVYREVEEKLQSDVFYNSASALNDLSEINRRLDECKGH